MRIVANAGGLNPAGLADAIRELAEKVGVPVRVAHVEGDSISVPEGFLTANAYLGGAGIAACLRAGAGVVVTGRVTDAALVTGPAAAHFGWGPDDHDALAGAVVAGHVLECGTQATGGNYAFFRDHDIRRPGFPVAEIHADGSSVITKHDGTGGVVDLGTVTAQLLYETGGARYAGPDVTARLDTATLTQDGPDRVRISGVRGEAPPPTLKAGLTRLGGWRNEVVFVLTGLDVEAKAALVRDQFADAFERAGRRPEEVRWELARTDSPDAGTEETASALLRLVVRDREQDAVGRALSGAAIELALGSYPGFHVTAPPGKGTPYGVFEARYVPARDVEHVAVLPDGTRQPVAHPVRTQDLHDVEQPPLPEPLEPGPTRRAPSAVSPRAQRRQGRGRQRRRLGPGRGRVAVAGARADRRAVPRTPPGDRRPHRRTPCPAEPKGVELHRPRAARRGRRRAAPLRPAGQGAGGVAALPPPGDTRHPSGGARMTVLPTGLDTASPDYAANRAAMLDKLAELEAAHAKALEGGGEKYIERHRGRGKLLARERIELLIDPDTPFLELSPLAAWGSEAPAYTVGASLVTGIGVVEGVECLITANDPTVRGGASNPWTLKKALRANEIAFANRLPCISLVESGGADLPSQKEIFIPGGALFRDITRLSAAGIPTVAVVFGNSTAGGAYVPGMSDHTVMIQERSKVFLGGPPLVKMATGEESDDESLGGAAMHARTSGLADHFAVDEHDALRQARRIVARLNWRKAHADPGPAEPPKYDEDELIGIVPGDLKVPFDPREVIARLVDGSDFDAFKPLYGTSLVTGWARLHGYPVGILANAQGVLFSEESQKAAQFIQLANQRDIPLLFLHNTTGYMVGKEYEQGGIIKHGAMMINAVSNSRVPHLSVLMGASYGAGHYGMCGRAYDPRFLFAWPGSKSAVMGPQQLAGVLSIVARASAAAKGRPYDDDADAALRAMVEQQIESESLPMFLSGRLYDDGVIDPRDTRTVLGMCLSAIHTAPVEGARGGFGVFRM